MMNPKNLIRIAAYILMFAVIYKIVSTYGITAYLYTSAALGLFALIAGIEFGDDDENDQN